MSFFETLNAQEVFKASMVLFAVIDIFGSIPIIIKVKENTGDIFPGRITVVSTLIMLAFLLGGEKLLGLFGVNIQSFAVAGAVILFLMAMEMILGRDFFKETHTGGKSASIVPLAFPIIAGAGSMTSLISLRAEFEMSNIVLSIFINMAVVYVVLKLTRRIERLLGQGGIAILKKVFGIILLAIAIKLFASNVTHILD
jgi:multiple antibiotic resistance protein